MFYVWCGDVWGDWRSLLQLLCELKLFGLTEAQNLA